jgi:N-sulfoglucosamine sulfohydrolase
MDRPNVLLITTHDSGRHFGCYGLPTLHTPAIDRIAAQGVRMSNYFATVPICAASRACMLTGHYPQRNGQLDLPVFGFDLNDSRTHLSHRLRDAGYETHLFNIQHETKDVASLGFDQVHREPGRQHADKVAGEVAALIQSRRDDSRPFYAQVGFFESHSPFAFGDIEPDTSRGVYIPPYIKPTGPAYELLAELQGAIRRIDVAVAMIDQALHEANLVQDTLLIFTTDHGVELPRAKWHLYDPGVEIALAARWPGGGIRGGQVCDWLSSNVDFTPTVLDLLDLPATGDLDGRSLAAGWRGRGGGGPHDCIFGFYLKSDNRSIRTNRHKLIRNFSVRGWPSVPNDIADPSRNRPLPMVELYDLHADPLEVQNLADSPEHAAIRSELDAKLWQWLENMDDPILQGPIRMPHYEQSMASYHQWKQSTQPRAASAS